MLKNAVRIAAMVTMHVVGLPAMAAVRVESLDANSAQRTVFTIGQTVNGSVINEGDAICHVTLQRPTNEVFGGESLQVERQVGDNWQTVNPTYADEPVYVYRAMPRGGSMMRRWRAEQPGVYRFRFRYVSARPNGTCNTSVGWNVRYSASFAVRTGTNSVRLSIVEITSDSVRYSGNLHVNVSLEYFLENASGAPTIGTYLEWFPSSSGGCNGTGSRTLASASTPASVGSGTAVFSLQWTVDRAEGWVGVGANLWSSSNAIAARADEFRHCIAIGR